MPEKGHGVSVTDRLMHVYQTEHASSQAQVVHMPLQNYIWAILEQGWQSFSAHAVDSHWLWFWQWCSCVNNTGPYCISNVFFCVSSWWGPVLTSSVWCPSWCSSSFRSWSSFFLSFWNSSQRCCPLLLRLSPKRYAMCTHTHSAICWHAAGFIEIM